MVVEFMFGVCDIAGVEESDTVDRLLEEEYEGREGNSGDGSSIKSEKRFVCNICQNAFKFKRSLTRHMKSTHEGGFGTCRVCGDVNFSQKVSYEKHLQKSQKHVRYARVEVCGSGWIGSDWIGSVRVTVSVSAAMLKSFATHQSVLKF